MPDDNIVEPAEAEQPTTLPPEEPTQVEEEAAPVEENAVDPREAKLAEYEAKIQRQATLLRASKDEALRLKNLVEAKAQPQEAQEDVLPVSPQDVAAFKALARAAGIPFKEEIQQETYSQKAESSKDKFLQEHPEYSKPGDEKSDELWDKLMNEAGRYKNPVKPEEWYSLLKEAHGKITANPGLDLEKGKSLGMAKANLNASLGGGTSGTASTPTSKKQTPEQKAVSEEFDKILRTKSYYKG